MGEKKREGKVETAIFSGGYLFVMIIDGHDRRSDVVGKYRTATKIRSLCVYGVRALAMRARGIYNESMKYGVIDIGSNSVRLMVSDGTKTLYKRVNTTRLSEGLGLTGKLTEAAMSRTADAAAEFVRAAEEDGCGEIYAFATEAVRSASNGGEFVAMAAARGVTVDVVRGETEAKLGFYGAYSGGRQAVLDIGGASTELAIGGEDGMEYGKSLHIGSVRIKDLCGEDTDKIRAFAAKTVEGYGDGLPPFDKLISIGGTGSTLVSVRERMKVYDTSRVHGAVLKREEIEKLAEDIHAVPLNERGAIDGLPEKRRDVIVGAALLMCAVMDRLGSKEIVVSERDNQEGYLRYRLGLIK